jgi:hypothetical protein
MLGVEGEIDENHFQLRNGNETYGLKHRNHVCLARMIVHLEIIIFNQLKQSSLMHIQLRLGEDILEAFMVSIDIAYIAQ